MTVGQRIAQKRKELGLSQEGLGEQLGVSRQAIYKWESDASLPEIDKLITLSRIFSVPVGWLLGVEEEASPRQRENSGEPAEGQLAMVQEIADRYLAAQTPPRRSVWDKWSVRVLFALCGVMLALLVGTNNKVKEMDRQYYDLRWSIDNISASVDSRISAAVRRMEETLKQQADLTSEWSAELVSTDLRASTATFQVRAVPKAFAEGMTAVFMAYSGGETVEAPTEPGAGHSFSGEITCPLSDEISLSVVFLSDGTGETQQLGNYCDLYSQSFPELTVSVGWRTGSDRNTLRPTGRDTATIVESGDGEVWTPAPPARLQVGLFRDRKLVLWYEPGVRYLDAIDREVPGWDLTEQVRLEPGHEYCVAALYTDEYGRRRIYQGSSTTYDPDPTSASATASVAVVTPGWGADPAGWEF